MALNEACSLHSASPSGSGSPRLGSDTIPRTMYHQYLQLSYVRNTRFHMARNQRSTSGKRDRQGILAHLEPGSLSSTPFPSLTTGSIASPPFRSPIKPFPSFSLTGMSRPRYIDRFSIRYRRSKSQPCALVEPRGSFRIGKSPEPSPNSLFHFLLVALRHASSYCLSSSSNPPSR